MLLIPHIPTMRKTTPTMEKKHELINQIGEKNLLHKTKSPKLGKNMVGGKNIARNTIPKHVIDS